MIKGIKPCLRFLKPVRRFVSAYMKFSYLSFLQNLLVSEVESTYWLDILIARLREVGRLCMTTYSLNILAYYFDILTYWKEYFYSPLINRAFEAIPCFTCLITLLTGYAIKWGLIVTYQ